LGKKSKIMSKTLKKDTFLTFSPKIMQGIWSLTIDLHLSAFSLAKNPFKNTFLEKVEKTRKVTFSEHYKAS